MHKGRYLTEVEIGDLKQKLNTNESLNNLLEELKKTAGISDEEFEITYPIKFDAISSNKQDIKTVTATILKFNDNVAVKYFERFTNGDTNTLESFAIGSVAIPDGEYQNIHTFKQGTAGIVRHEVEKELTELFLESLNKDEDFDEVFQPDPSYNPGEKNLETQGWWDGCIAGGYIWCGSGCQYSSTPCKGPIKGKNKLDYECCRLHDCCYHANGTTPPDCYCDQTLCDCAQRVDRWGTASLLIQGVMCFVC
ncbi:hypothetical protein [Bacillus wiedmannii]|uniref:hypothetical protein n=1 Tax=Bacillus wiedmannii TaxID=1890302 RepID=UPI000D093796|nr:hypothetical protein [Bacillus wiedmannii]PRT15850.1 hypothetical protein C6360_27390 [Bacillus wiedmannii]